MGNRAEKVMKESSYVRELFYGDGYTCKSIKNCSYNRYISDNVENQAVLVEVIISPGIKLVISPTGSGKSISILDRAKAITARDKSCKVILALPTVALTEQLSKQNGVTRLIGGDAFDSEGQIFATTYEKMFEVKDYISLQKAKKQTGKNYLILDECHLFTSQHLFRQGAIKDVIQAIEENLFDSVCLVTATPEPVSLFHCNQIVQFESTQKNLAIEGIEIVVVDDVLEYLKGLDITKEYPFIRLNSKSKIEQLRQDAPFELTRITSDDKKTSAYADIVEKSKISANGADGMVCTSVLEAGVSVVDYPQGLVPICAFPDNNISCDDIEQFVNRIRKNGKNHIKSARVVLKRPKPKEIKVSLIKADGTEVVVFKDFTIQDGELYLKDTYLLDSVPEGPYKIKMQMGTDTVQYRDFAVFSEGDTTDRWYSKVDKRQVIIKQMGFKEFTVILSANYNRCMKFMERMQIYADTLEQKREELSAEGCDSIDDMLESDKVLIGDMIQCSIDKMGTLKDCLSYNGKEIVFDKRVLYMLSYNQFQRQYYMHHEKLREELEERLGIPVWISDEKTEKGKTEYNAADIWEDIEDLRLQIERNCNQDFYDALMGNGSFYMKFPKWREMVRSIREQDHLMEMLTEMEKVAITGKVALKILVLSKTKSKVTKFKNMHSLIVQNRVLKRLGESDAKKIPSSNKEQQIQAIIYCYIMEKNQSTFKFTDEMLESIVERYKMNYPLSAKLPTSRMIKSMMKKMYKSKGNTTVRNEIRVDSEDIFKLVDSDYE